ncbi:MAG: phospholipase D-like domain-containing protein [Candidatus Asgardarchaeia archaeon]
MRKASIKLAFVIGILMFITVLYPLNGLGYENTLQMNNFDSFSSSVVFKGNMKIITFTSPDSSYNVLINLIEHAQNEINIEIYSIYNPYLLKALNDAEARGVDVTVLTEKYHASPFENDHNIWAAWNLTQAGADVYWTNDTEFAYTHAKMAIIDSSITVIMSGNWVKTGVPIHPSYGNREWGVVIYSTDVASYFNNIFLDDLAIATPYSSSDGTGDDVTAYIRHGKYPHPFSNKTFEGTFEVYPVLSPDNSEDMIKQLIASANVSLDIAQLYIYKDWSSTLSPFVEEIVNAAQRGVQVRIILNNGSSANEDLINYLESYDNIAIALSNETYFETYHVKGVIVDGKLVLVSSINWSKNSVRNNREAGVIIKSEEVSTYFKSIFDWDWSVSQIVFNHLSQTQPPSQNENQTQVPPQNETTNQPPSGTEELPTDYVAITILIIVIAIVVSFIKKKK